VTRERKKRERKGKKIQQSFEELYCTASDIDTEWQKADFQEIVQGQD